VYRRGFETLLLEAVDEQLTSLGESSKQALYFHLEKGFNIRKNEIPYKTEAFVTAMEKIFGLGADYLEILIMKSLHDKIGKRIDLDKTTLTFLEYVEAAKRSYYEKKKSKREELKRCQQVRVKC
jgi:hypothetical protein